MLGSLAFCLSQCRIATIYFPNVMSIPVSESEQTAPIRVISTQTPLHLNIHFEIKKKLI